MFWNTIMVLLSAFFFYLFFFTLVWYNYVKGNFPWRQKKKKRFNAFLARGVFLDQISIMWTLNNTIRIFFSFLSFLSGWQSLLKGLSVRSFKKDFSVRIFKSLAKAGRLLAVSGVRCCLGPLRATRRPRIFKIDMAKKQRWLSLCEYVYLLGSCKGLLCGVKRREPAD